MKSVLLFGVMAFFAASCNRIQSESVDANASLRNADNRAAFNRSPNPAMPSPTTPTNMISEPPSINEADYIVSKFDHAKMRATTLGTQPLEIIKDIAAFDPERLKQSNPNFNLQQELKAFDKYKIKTAEYDFNHDGTAERIIVSRGETGGEVELFSVYIRRNDQWHSIFAIEGDPDEPRVPKIQMLTEKNKNGFDLIKTIAENGAGDGSQDIKYYRMQTERYEAID